jgi:hypothetical protein
MIAELRYDVGFRGLATRATQLRDETILVR